MRRSLVASVVPVAALVVLLAAGSAAPTQLVAVGKGPGTPPRLSSTALAAWAGADRRAGEAEAAYVTAVASCRDQTPGGMAGADDCLSISQHSLLVEVGSALATARTLYGADGPVRAVAARLSRPPRHLPRLDPALVGGGARGSAARAGGRLARDRGILERHPRRGAGSPRRLHPAAVAVWNHCS